MNIRTHGTGAVTINDIHNIGITDACWTRDDINNGYNVAAALVEITKLVRGKV